MMRLEVISFKENEDGSANLEVEMDEKTKAFLIQEGMLALIEKGLEAHPLPEGVYDDITD